MFGSAFCGSRARADGIASGLWERKQSGKRIELRVTPARKLTRSQRAQLDQETERIGAFAELEPVLTVV